MIATAKRINYDDFFKILDKKPRMVEITSIKITEDSAMYEYADINIGFAIYDSETKTYPYHAQYTWTVGDEGDYYYIKLNHGLIPLLKFAGDINDDSPLVVDNESLEDLVGMRFLATIIKHKNSYELIPVTEDAVND